MTSYDINIRYKTNVFVKKLRVIFYKYLNIKNNQRKNKIKLFYH